MGVREFKGYGGVNIVAETFGSEDHPSVLFLHGIGRLRHDWNEAAKALASAGRYVVCPDLRGHGDSERPAGGQYDTDAFSGDLLAVLTQLSSRPVIVGSTLGGWIATAALGEAKAPLASGLVLVNPPGLLTLGTAAAFREAVGRLLAEAQRTGRFDPRVMSGGLNAGAIEILQMRLQEAAANIKVPVLLVRGADDPFSPPEITDALAKKFPNAETIEIPSGGHDVAFEQAEAFNGELLAFLERCIPREPPEYVSGSDPRTLRDAMGCFATGVTVITTRAPDGQPVGLTANSFTSVSLDPPLVLVCLGKKVSSIDAFNAAKALAINLLHIGQQPTSNLFASKGRNRFAETQWETWEHDVPIISNSLASFECLIRSNFEQGDHRIFIGEVVRARYEQRRDPLLYFCGKYRRLHFE
jgi:flavin reductase (DIM6/NTAB) family NADH-FMN oxidoreductase RutF/pimeloyl-ACP methyl ester carboxylesterase